MVIMVEMKYVAAAYSNLNLGLFDRVFRYKMGKYMVANLMALMWCDKWLLDGSFIMDLVVVLTSHFHDDWWMYDSPLRISRVAF